MKKSLATLLLTLCMAHAAAWANIRGVAPAVAQQPAAEAQATAEEEARLNASVVRLYNEGKLDEALPPARRVLELREKRYGPEHLLVASALKNLAAIHVGKNNSGEAQKLYQRALDILVKHGEAQASSASDIAVQLGIMRFRARDYEEADELLKRAVALKEQAVGATGRDVAAPLFVLADAQFARHGFEKAEPFYDRALKLLESAPPQKDPAAVRHLETLLCHLNNPRGKETSKRVSKLIFRLDNPEQAAEFERREKERKEKAAAGGSDDEAVSGGVLNGRATSKPAPSYPEEALRARAQGTVIVSITVDEQGRVTRARAICGHPLLKETSEEAAKRARFSPTLLWGAPVKVTGVITYNYVLR